MSVTIEQVEEAGSRAAIIQRVGKKQKSTVTLKYKLLGATDDAVVHQACDQFFSANRTYRVLGYVLLVDHYEIAHLGGDAWDIVAYYESMGFDTDRDPMRRARSFTTGSSSTRKTHAKAQRRYPADAPDINNAIGVNADNTVSGVEVPVPSLSWMETYDVPSEMVTLDYIKFLSAMKGRTNKKAFRGFAPGEVRFDGPEGSQQWDEEKGDGPWNLNFRFTAEPNAGDEGTIPALEIGDITGVEKKGHEYLEVKYDQTVVDGVTVPKPAAVYVSEVLDEVDFALFGIGVD
jgi:hypothetical protein